MNCWHCGHELIWGGDHDTEDNEDYDIVSNLSCPNCHSAVDVWHPSEKLIEEYDLLTIESRAGYKNVIAILEYTKETRKLFRELEEENKKVKNQVLELKSVIDQMRGQITKLLMSTYGNGPTS